jgi:hypothetical protein
MPSSSRQTFGSNAVRATRQVARRQILLTGFLLLAAAGPAWGAFPSNPHYPHYNYPSVLEAPRGYGPTPVYGFAGPSYRWGWFGAQYRPRTVHHTGYFGDYWQTGYRWGY